MLGRRILRCEVPKEVSVKLARAELAKFTKYSFTATGRKGDTEKDATAISPDRATSLRAYIDRDGIMSIAFMSSQAARSFVLM